MADGQDKIKVFELNTKAATTSIKELRLLLKAYKDEMAGLEEGSDEFLAVANAAGLVKHLLDEISQSINGASADFGDMLASGTKTMQGLLGSFQAVNGALTLFGVESEEVTKAIQKMQASMAIIQGLDAIDNGIKGFKKFTTAIKASTQGLSTFKKALIGTGIGAFVILIAELVAHFDDLDKLLGGKLSKTLDGLKGVFSNLGNEIKAIGKLVLTSLVAPFKSYVELLKGVGNVIKAVFEGEFKTIGNIVDETKTAMAEPFKVVADEAKNVGTAFVQGFNDGVDAANAERVAKAKEIADKQLEEFRKREEERINIELERNKRLEQSDVDRLQKEIELEEQRLKLLDENTLAYEQQLTKIHELKQKLAEASQTDSVDGTTTTENGEGLSKEDLELQRKMTAWTAEEQTFELHQAEMQRLLDEAYAKQLITDEQYSAGVKRLAKERADEEKKQAQRAVNNAAAIAGGLANILSTIASTQDTTNREGFERSKKMQTAAAVIQGLVGVTTALSGAFTTKTGPWDIALAVVQAATIAASTGAQIAQILKQTFDGGGSSSVSAAASPSASAVNATIMAPSDYSTAVQSAELETKIGDTKVYVTETDIAKTTNKVLVQETENRY